MALSYKNIFELNVKYIDYLLSKSLLSHQYIKNIAQSGSEIEHEVRDLFRNLIPNRFHVTHGYIVSAKSQSEEPLVSPQIDMMIVDTLVTHSIFTVDKQSGMEIVPREAVVAVFEIKRTLSKDVLLGTESINGAIQHIKNIKERVGIKKNSQERFGPGGITFSNGLTGGSFFNPMLGIISLDFDDKLINPSSEHYINKFQDQINIAELDMVSSLSGLICAIQDEQKLSWFKIENPRTKKKYKYLTIDKNFHSQAEIVAKIMGYILGYLNQVNGKMILSFR